MCVCVSVSGGDGSLHPFLETKGMRRIINALTTPKAQKRRKPKKKKSIAYLCSGTLEAIQTKINEQRRRNVNRFRSRTSSQRHSSPFFLFFPVYNSTFVVFWFGGIEEGRECLAGVMLSVRLHDNSSLRYCHVSLLTPLPFLPISRIQSPSHIPFFPFPSF